MARIEVFCKGERWQDDFTPIVGRLERYFGACFRAAPDREEIVQNGVLLMMDQFIRRWRRDQTVRLNAKFVVWDLRRGREYLMGTRNHKRRYDVSLDERMYNLPRRSIPRLAWVEYRRYTAGLNSRERDVLDWLVSGHTVYQVRRAFGLQHYDVERIVRAALAQLAD